MWCVESRLKGPVESAGLSEYARYCLREICSQEWVREKFLRQTDQLFTADLLLDKMLSHQQVSNRLVVQYSLLRESISAFCFALVKSFGHTCHLPRKRSVPIPMIGIE